MAWLTQNFGFELFEISILFSELNQRIRSPTL